MLRKHACFVFSFLLAFLVLVPGNARTHSGHHHGPGDEHDHAKEKIINKKDGSIMCLIPFGIYRMGSNSGEGNERPVHLVRLKPFYIDQYEITNIQYRRFIEETGHSEPPYWDNPLFNGNLQPVIGVSWEDAHAYAKWAGKRLPTEAEWELAARSPDGREYPWGNNWHDGRCNDAKSGSSHPVQVGSYPEGASPYGIYDMAGNVWEWCWDSYSNKYYEESPESNPKGPKTGNDKVLRGGCWDSEMMKLRSSSRFWDNKDSRTTKYGFRCVKDME